jgi:hypothetical protein
MAIPVLIGTHHEGCLALEGAAHEPTMVSVKAYRRDDAGDDRVIDPVGIDPADTSIADQDRELVGGARSGLAADVLEGFGPSR